MAATSRPALLSGAALAGTAALVLAAPAGLPGVPTPVQLSTAQYELTALSDVTVAGVLESFTTGWGGFIGPDDVFYPGEFANDVLISGFGGVAYYVVDQALDGLVPLNLENYFFEVGSRSPGNEIASGVGAAAFVGVGSVFGVDSAPAQLVKVLLGGGGFDLGTALVSLTAGIPVVGDLASVYFTGQIAGDETDYGTGLAGVIAYAGTLLGGQPGTFDLSGLLAGVTSLVTSIGDLISGNSNGNGGGGASSGDDVDDSDAESEDDDSDTDEEADSDDTDEDTEADTDDNEGNGHGNGHGNRRVAVTPSATAPAAPAASVMSAKVEAAEEAEVDADIDDFDAADVDAAQKDPAGAKAPKRGAQRSGGAGAEKSAGRSTR